jgi:hypothetical protein
MGERKDSALISLVPDLLFPPIGPRPMLWDGEIALLRPEELAVARLEVGHKQEGVSTYSHRGSACGLF